MAGSTFGKAFQITTFGESHGSGIGVVIDGCPAGLELDFDAIQLQLDRRKPGQSKITTQRKESDTAKYLSGLLNNVTTGAPIAIWIGNLDQKSHDYDHIEKAFRPSHADFTYFSKYSIRDHRGGGRSSARETAARVAAGAIARQLCEQLSIETLAYVNQIGHLATANDYTNTTINAIESNAVRCPDTTLAKAMEDLIVKIKTDGNTVGGCITGVIKGLPVGLGEPVFDRLEADLAKAMLSINAVKGFEIGSGFAGAEMLGSDHNDRFDTDAQGNVYTTSNNSGGVQGGISNGMPVYFKVAFKPTSTIMQKQTTVNTQGDKTEIEGKGRHDPCVVPRAVPIVEAMASLVVADHLLRANNSKLDNLKAHYARI